MRGLGSAGLAGLGLEGRPGTRLGLHAEAVRRVGHREGGPGGSAVVGQWKEEERGWRLRSRGPEGRRRNRSGWEWREGR